MEYVVIVIRQRVVRWFSLQEGVYREVTTPDNGIFKSDTFPGLWLAAEALLQLDGATVMDTLNQGLAMPEHAAFVQQLQRQRGRV